MFGWEFPPHISGGLGTACMGLTKGLSKIPKTKIYFVVPKAFGDEKSDSLKVIGANTVPMETDTTTIKAILYHPIDSDAKVNLPEKTVSKNKEKDVDYIGIASLLRPYMTAEQFEDILIKNNIEPSKVYFNTDGKLVYLIGEKEHEITIDYSDLNSSKKRNVKFKFTGNYGEQLFEEVERYADIAVKIAKQKNIDIIHAHDWLTILAGVETKKAINKPLVVHIHATEFDRSGMYVNQRIYDIERYGIENADKIITVSNYTKNILIEKYNAIPEKIETIYNAVNFKLNKKIEKNNTDEKIISFLGRITYQKGPEYFIEAAYKVLLKNKNVRFVMAGSGDLLYKMIRRVAELGISDKFHFTSFLKDDEVKHLFSISDVYIMPSVSEPFGISTLEAMSSSVPTIISKQSGVSEVLKHVYKVDFWDIEAMANAIHGIINYQSLANMLGKNGKKEVKKLKWDYAAVKVHKLYKSLIKQ